MAAVLIASKYLVLTNISEKIDSGQLELFTCEQFQGTKSVPTRLCEWHYHQESAT
jgi:hypothetical protein